MISDEERREVATRLRSFVTDDSVYADVDAFRVLHSIGLYYKDIDRIYFSGFDVARLADLIDPDTTTDTTKTPTDTTKRDRGALLKLADDMDKWALTCDHYDRQVSPLDVTKYARRIREACGEEGA